MALQIIYPYVHVEDSNGLPIVGAKLYVYLVGTTTPASIYSDEGLSVPISNPLSGANASSATGDFPRIYIAAGTYKLRAETSAGALIWQEDNIDTGLPAGTGALSVARGGTGGTTAAAARTNLGVPSSSELTALSISIVSIQATLQNIVSIPQGYLTPTTAVPIISTGVTAGTSVYYTPYTGNLIPIYDGSQFNTVAFSELTLTLNSNHTASNIYDAFVFKDSGIITIGTGPAWNTATAGAGARGTGAGTTEITRTKGGLWTNAFAMTTRNGATTYSVNANCGTYVGSLYMDGTNGQISCLIAIGQSRKWSVWNAYNRVPISLLVADPTASWGYNTSAWRQSRADATNTLAVFTGLAEERIFTRFVQSGQTVDNNTTSDMEIAIGLNSTSSPSGKLGFLYSSIASAITNTQKADLIAEYINAPALGVNNFNALENGLASNAATFIGTSASMLLSAMYRG